MQCKEANSKKSEDASDPKIGPEEGEEINGIDDEILAEPEVPVEDYGGQLPKAMTAPTPPSRQEALEHRVLHCPFRAWCPECVAGKSK